MNLDVALFKDQTQSTYRDLLSYFVRQAQSQSVFRDRLWDHLATVIALPLPPGAPEYLGAKLVARPDLDTFSHSLRAQVAAAGAAFRNPVEAGPWDDWAHVIDHFMLRTGPDTQLHLAAVYLASWLSLEAEHNLLMRLHVGSTALGQRLWGTSCPVLARLSELLTSHCRELGIAPPSLKQLPQGVPGEYLTFRSIHQLLDFAAFCFAALNDRYVACLVQSAAVMARQPGAVLPPELPAPAPTTTRSAPSQPSAAPDPRRNLLQHLLEPYTGEVPARLEQLAKAQYFQLADDELSFLVWTMPLSALAQVYGLPVSMLKRDLNARQISCPPHHFWHRVRHGQHPYPAGEPAAPGAEVNVAAGDAQTKLQLALNLLEPYRTTLPAQLQEVLERQVPVTQWSPALLQRMLWTLPVVDLCLLVDISPQAYYQLLDQASITEKPPVGFWPKVRAGVLPYPDGIPPSSQTPPRPRTKPRRSPEQRIAQARELLAPYTQELPQAVVQVLKDQKPLAQWSAEVLEAVIWSMPISVFCQLFSTSSVRLHQALKQARIDTLPERSLWAAVRAGHATYPNGVAPGKDGLTPAQRRMRAHAQALLSGYTEQLPEPIWQLIRHPVGYRELTPEQLKALVWCIPVAKLGELLAVPPGRLNRLIKRHQIPSPCPSFWANVRRGHFPYPNGEINERGLTAEA